MFNPFVVTVGLQHWQRGAQSFPGMQGIWKGLLDRMPPFQYHETTPETSCCCLGLSRKGALPKPLDLGSSSVAVRDRQSCSPEPRSLGSKAAAPALLRGGVSLPAGTSRTVVCQASCLWAGFPNAVPRDRKYRACPAQRTPLLCCSYSSGTQCHTQILSKGRNPSAKDTSREALNCNRMGIAQSGTSCLFCTPVGKRIHPQLFPEAKLSNGALPRLLKGKQGPFSMYTGTNLRKNIRNSHLSSCIPLLGPKRELHQQNQGSFKGFINSTVH